VFLAGGAREPKVGLRLKSQISYRQTGAPYNTRNKRMDNTASGNHLTCNPTLLDSAPTVNRKRRGACLYQIRVSETRFNRH